MIDRRELDRRQLERSSSQDRRARARAALKDYRALGERRARIEAAREAQANAFVAAWLERFAIARRS